MVTILDFSMLCKNNMHSVETIEIKVCNFIILNRGGGYKNSTTVISVVYK